MVVGTVITDGLIRGSLGGEVATHGRGTMAHGQLALFEAKLRTLAYASKTGLLGRLRAAWEGIIEEHLQGEDMLASGIRIEIRNDNGPQFLAAKLRQFFLANHLCQVFTHPYTPQENGHVESFHSIISQATQGDTFWTLAQLAQRLTIF